MTQPQQQQQNGPMDDAEYAAYHDQKYAGLPADFKSEAIKLLRDELGDQLIAQVRMLHLTHGAKWIHEIPMGHFGWGMAIRNLLRTKGLTDARAGGNLDDYYVQLVEAAAGCRPE